MFTKIIAFGAALTIASASWQGQGQAISSQRIVLHNIPVHYTTHHANQISQLSSAFDQPATNFVGYTAPIAQYSAPIRQDATPIVEYNGENDDYVRPRNDFSYSVADSRTINHRPQYESGDGVRGYYTVVQPDGTVRKVEYRTDNNRSNAAVRNTRPYAHLQTFGRSNGYIYNY